MPLDQGLLAQLFEQQPQPAFYIEPVFSEHGTIADWRYQYANLAFYAYARTTAEALIGAVLSASPVVSRPELRLRLFGELQAAWDKGSADEVRINNPDMKRYYSYTRRRVGEGILTVIQDRTQERMMLNRLQAVFEAAQAGMFTFSPVRDAAGTITDFRFVITNPVFAAYVGQTPETLQGTLGSTWFPGYLTNGVFDMYRHTYETGETMRRDVHYNVDGHDLYLDLRSQKVDDEVLITFTDYTTLKVAQLRLEKLVEELKRSNNYLEEFAHAASHDMKEPIRKIRLFADRLCASLQGRTSGEESDLFQRMMAATERMQQLVDDLLSYAHLSVHPAVMDEVDLSEYLRLVLGDLEVAVEEKGAVVEAGALPKVRGYRRQLQQLLQNLLSNALKYSRPGVPPRIRIAASEVQGGAVLPPLPEGDVGKAFHHIIVEDNGIGFDPEFAERIFGMFTRLHGRSEYPGTGVGLSIARKVAENHGGYIWAESRPGEGATFHVLLPAGDA